MGRTPGEDREGDITFPSTELLSIPDLLSSQSCTSRAHSIPPVIKLESKPWHGSSSLSPRAQLPAESHRFFLPDLMPGGREATVRSLHPR